MGCFIHLPALYDQGTPNTHPHNPSVRIRNKTSSSYRKWDSGGRTVTKYQFQSMEDGVKEDHILLEITGTSFYAEEGKMSCCSCCHLSKPFLCLIPSFSAPFPSIPRLLRNPTLLSQWFRGLAPQVQHKGCRHPAQHSSMCWKSYRDFFFFSFVWDQLRD